MGSSSIELPKFFEDFSYGQFCLCNKSNSSYFAIAKNIFDGASPHTPNSQIDK